MSACPKCGEQCSDITDLASLPRGAFVIQKPSKQRMEMWQSARASKYMGYTPEPAPEYVRVLSTFTAPDGTLSVAVSGPKGGQWIVPLSEIDPVVPLPEAVA